MRKYLILQRRSHNWTQRQVAQLIGLSVQMISMIETGKRNPSKLTMDKMEDLFGIPQRELFENHDTKT